MQETPSLIVLVQIMPNDKNNFYTTLSNYCNALVLLDVYYYIITSLL
jgi:hypothetical protein